MSAGTATPPPTGRRRLAARGTLINAGFQIGFGATNLLKALIAAAFLSASDYGIWGIVLVTVTLVGVMRTAAVGDKYIQQSEDDQEEAFRKAFTLELIFSLLMFALACALAPLVGLIYGEWDLVWPCLVLALVLPGLSLQAPAWIFYRRMDYLRQRLILSVDPAIAFVLTVALAWAGAGYWSLVLGVVAGSLASGAVAMLMSPIKPEWHYDRSAVRDYFEFSWPLVLAAAAGVMIGQVSVLLGDLALGLAGAGAIALAASLSLYSESVDRIVTQTLYPAICRVAERRELLLEIFTKSNRLTLMWGLPFGVGLALFASDLVHFALGDQWIPAITLIQVFGVVAALNHIGFNWDAFYRATGRTRPMAVVSIAALGSVTVTAAPLIFIYGLDGYAVGVGVMTTVILGLRWHYLRRIFPDLHLGRYVVRALLPTLPAVGAVLALRYVVDQPRSVELALLELGLYLGITAVLTWTFERPLLKEAIGYLRSAESAPRAPPDERRAFKWAG